jgi:hypothetical protein
MILEKREIVYAGLGLFLFLVFYSSTRKVNLIEIKENEVKGNEFKKNFDNYRLPKFLRPPKKLMDGEPIPQGAERKQNNVLQPRLDTWY